jgi:hypothetical protein
MVKIKKIIWVLVSGIVIVSTFVNIKNQFNTLESAKSKNEDLKLKLEQIDILRNNLTKKIEYSTSSAFVNSQRKELLGLGTDNDYWLDIKEDSGKPEEIIRQVYESKSESNPEKWLSLFTD